MIKSADLEKDFIKFFEIDKKPHKSKAKIKLLIIGKSDVTLKLINKIKKLVNYQKIVHVVDAIQAAREMLSDRFTVIIIDDESNNVNVVSVSRIIRINNPLARSIVISSDTSIPFLTSIINQGSIDTFVPIPVDDYTIYSIILDQQSRYEISSRLNEIILNPPKYTPAYYLNQDPTLLPDEENKKSKVIGCVISYQSVTRYSKFFHDVLINDEFLLTGYISAMTTLGEELFQTGKIIREINFGGISVFFIIENELQFAIFVNDLTRSNYDQTEEMVTEIVMDVVYLSGLNLSNDVPIGEEENHRIDKIIREKIRSIKKFPDKSSTDKPVILMCGVQYLITSIVLNSLQNEFSIYTVQNEEDALIYLFENDVDVLLISPILSKKISYTHFAKKIKEKLPKTQIIGLFNQFQSEYLIEIINSNSVDKVVSNDYWINDFRIIIKKAATKAKTMKKSKISLSNQNFLFSYDQSVIARTMLKEEKYYFNRINTPELHSLIIIRDDLPFYTKYWKHGNISIELDEMMFAGYISSIASFSREMFVKTEPYASIAFGDASLIILNYFDISFVFFVVNVDHSNYAIARKYIETAVFILYNLITNTRFNNLEEWDTELPSKIEQISIELFLKFACLSLT